MDLPYLASSGSLVDVQPATWRDLNALRQLEVVCFPNDSWPLVDLIGVLVLPNVVRLKAVLDGYMVGFVAGDIRQKEKLAWIATIGVLPAHRRKGIGSLLLRACEEHLPVPRVRLSVRASNQPALNLYERAGYQRYAFWQGYYQDGEGAVVLEKII